MTYPPHESFVIIDYDDKISLDYWHSTYTDLKFHEIFKIKNLIDVENFVEKLYKNYPNRERILKKPDDYTINDAFKIGSWRMPDRFIYMFRNGKWYQLLYQNGGNNIFEFVE